MYYWINGAQEGTRTPTPLTEPAPEAGASTNFATWATGDILRYFPLDVKGKPCHCYANLNANHQIDQFSRDIDFFNNFFVSQEIFNFFFGCGNNGIFVSRFVNFKLSA